jgi:predicted TIM-barrel fold metal-dependent hydrolase
MITPKQALKDIDKLDLESDTKKKFLFENAKKVFKIK